MKELNLDLQKLLAGKTSIAGFFSKGTKEEKVTNLEKQIAEKSNQSLSIPALNFIEAEAILVILLVCIIAAI